MNGLLLLASDSATTHAEVPTWVTVLFGVILALSLIHISEPTRP